jgi:hypothetical protein
MCRMHRPDVDAEKKISLPFEQQAILDAWVIPLLLPGVLSAG